jgi:hypothetical protein
MLTFIIFILATIGLTFIITQSSLFKPIRGIAGKIHPKFGKFLHCPMCIGFWAGLIVYLLSYFKLDIINYGFIGSFVSYLAYLLMFPIMDKFD